MFEVETEINKTKNILYATDLIDILNKKILEIENQPYRPTFIGEETRRDKVERIKDVINIITEVLKS